MSKELIDYVKYSIVEGEEHFDDALTWACSQLEMNVNDGQAVFNDQKTLKDLKEDIEDALYACGWTDEEISNFMYTAFEEYVYPMRITFLDDGLTFIDGHVGLNEAHAIHLAELNWSGAVIEIIK